MGRRTAGVSPVMLKWANNSGYYYYLNSWLNRFIRKVNQEGFVYFCCRCFAPDTQTYQEHFQYRKTLIEEYIYNVKYIHLYFYVCGDYLLLPSKAGNWYSYYWRCLISHASLLPWIDEGVTCSMQGKTGRMYASRHFIQNSSIYTIYHTPTYTFHDKDTSQNSLQNALYIAQRSI